MHWEPRIRAALMNAGAAPDDEIVEELVQHASAMYETARANGRPPDVAERAVEEQIAIWSQDARSLTRRPRRVSVVPPPSEVRSRWTGVVHDIRYGFRVLRRQPGYSTVAALTMALGIGATTLLFSVAWSVLMKPLPWPNAARLVVVKETRGGSPPRFNSFSNAAYFAWLADARTIETLAAWSQRTVTITDNDEPERIRVVSASGNLFAVLGAHPLIGSLFSEEDERSAVVVLSESFWRQRFGGDPGVLGRSLQLDGDSFTVLGVLPQAAAYPTSQIRAWIPFRVPPATGNQLSLFDAIALLRPEATPAQAAAEGTARGAFVADTGLTTTAVFGSTGRVEISAQPLHEAVSSDVRSPLLILLAAVALLLLAATGNVTSLQLARAMARRREVAIRAAIGAGTMRLARQLITETLWLGMAGGALGLGLASLLHGLLPALLPADFPRLEGIGVTVAVLLFATAVSILTSIIVGVLPALSVRRLNVVDGLTEHGGVPSASRRSRVLGTRALIMGGQVAIACVLLVGASLLGRSFLALLHADRGYDPSNVLTARVPMGAAAYTAERRYMLVDDLLARLAPIPNALVAFTSELPLTPGGSTAAFTLASRGSSGPVAVQTSPRVVSPRYFAVLRIPIIEGRSFAETDTATSPPVAIVNRAFARRYLGDSALGAPVPMAAGYSNEGRDATIVGIADDVRYPAAARPTQPEIYYSFRQMSGKLPVPVITLVVRTTDDPQKIAGVVRGAVRSVDANLVADAISTMSDRISTSIARPRLYAVLLGGFAAFALAIAGVGLFGVLSYTVAHRSRELAVRAALGASPSAILRLVVVEGLAVTLAGVVVGLAAALGVVRWLGTLLYGVAPHDPVTFVAVPLLLLGVAALACAVPARRAARIDPLKVLKGA